MRGRCLGFGVSVVIACGLIAVAAHPVSAAPPSNDDFASATVIAPSALPFTDAVDATDATTEIDDPSSPCDTFVDQSVWWRITPSTTEQLRADAFGSIATGFVSVWRGTALASLTLVGCNAFATDGTRAGRVAWHAVAGKHYYIRITEAQQVSFHLFKVTAPSNDSFAGAKTIASLPFGADVTNVNASTEKTEPVSYPCGYQEATLWYRFKPASSLVVRADTFLSSDDTTLAVFRGTAIGSPVPVICNNNIRAVGNGRTSSVAWKASAGTTYMIQVGGSLGGNGDIHLRLVKATPPANDDFAHAKTVLADGALHLATTFSATSQPNEQVGTLNFCSYGAQNQSVWYKLTAPSTHSYTFDPTGSDFEAAIAVWTGSTLGSLTERACGVNGVSAPVTYTASSGTVLWIQASGFGEAGHLHLKVTQ
jgi:hypothetical protein